MDMTFAILHPGKSQVDTIAPLLFISEFAIEQGIRLTDGPLFDDLLSREDAIDHIHILGRRAHLDSDGFTIVRELISRDIEPIVGLYGRCLVLQREDHKGTFDRVIATDCLHQMLTTLLCYLSNRNRLAGL